MVVSRTSTTPTAPRSPAIDSGPDPTRVTRFACDLASVWPKAGDAGAKLGIAVSGGPDSVALLLLANQALPGRIEAATVDHGLRTESAGEAAFVAELCGELGIPHAILTCAVEPGNTQDRARRARYAALDRWAEARGLAAIATAHHADDQAETLLMRLNRGSGLAGLAGVRASTYVPDGATALVRPLLGWRRAELEDVVAAAGIDPVRDRSNEDARFDRVRMRKALQSADWLDPAALATSAAHLAEAEQALESYAQREWETCVAREATTIRYRPDAPDLVRKLVVRRIVDELGGAPDLSQVADLVRKLERGESANVAGVLGRASRNVWLFEPEPPRKTAFKEIPPDTITSPRA